jgi:hypothetical protein
MYLRDMWYAHLVVTVESTTRSHRRPSCLIDVHLAKPAAWPRRTTCDSSATESRKLAVAESLDPGVALRACLSSPPVDLTTPASTSANAVPGCSWHMAE